MIDKLFVFMMGLFLAGTFVVDLYSQEIPKNEYLDYMELSYPKLTPQSSASAELFLFGNENDPNYVDVNPKDGIDDQRFNVLQDLAVRFAPYLVQNSVAVPMNFKKFMQDQPAFHLHIDTWDVFGERAKIIDSQTINFVELDRVSCDSTVLLDALNKEKNAVAERSGNFELVNSAASEDCKLLALLQEFYPENPKNWRIVEKFKRQSPDALKVLYFNFPGTGPETWMDEYINDQTNALPKKYHDYVSSYVHPFIHEVQSNDTGTSLGYEFILQYWFFYPFNDGGNNHEGDWEHMNIVVSPVDRVERLMTAEEIQTLLAGTWLSDNDKKHQLVIKRLEYYFHYDVMTLDFASPNVYKSRDEWEAQVKVLSQQAERLNEKEIWKSIRQLAYRDNAEEQINTHTIGYIGADNKGFDQMLQMPGARNRDSHGTYPFGGIFKNVGPAGATEKITTTVDPKELFDQIDNAEHELEIFKRGNVVNLAHPTRVEIVPDWERVMDLAQEDAKVRREWSWLLLPIHWGYPATASPLAGVLKHTDTGNVPPVTPSCGFGWNVSGPSFGYHTYEPHQMAPVFPTGFQDNFANNLGFLNLTFPLLSNLPPLDFLWRIAAYPFRLAINRPDPVYYPADSVPHRFVGLGAGVDIQTMDKDFAALMTNNQQLDELIASVILHLAMNGVDSTTTVTTSTTDLENVVAPFYQAVFYIGDRFVTENRVRHSQSALRYDASFSNIPAYNYSAVINMWEYTGSFRYNLSTSNFQPYVKGGYGLSWYRLEDTKVNDFDFSNSTSEWIRKPSLTTLKNLLPNTWHIGAGLEFNILKKRGRLPQGFDLSVRADYTLYSHQLGLDLSGVPLDELQLLFPTLESVPGGEQVTRQSFSFGLVFGF